MVRRSVLPVAAGLGAAVLYCLLMPLWEGYDEPYHYGIVQWVGIGHSLPDTSWTVLSDEVAQSILLAPASPVVKRDHPAAVGFDEFRSMPQAGRLRLRRELEELAPVLQYRFASGLRNHEAQQPPLAYALLAVPDRLLARASLVWRVRALRLLIACATVILLAAGMLRLGRALEVPEPWLSAAVVAVLLTQTFLATICRVSNDWLVVILVPWLFVSAVALLRRPSASHAFWMGACLAGGLLSKASFLAFVPPVCALLVLLAFRRAVGSRALVAFAAPLAVAAPWYVRNLVLYGSLTGWGATVWPRTSAQVRQAMLEIPWLRALPGFGRQALWEANSSGTAFSAATMNLMLVLLAAAALLLLRALARSRPCGAVWLVLSGAALYAGALVYSIGDTYVINAKRIYAVMPWFCPPLFPLASLVLFWGMARAGAAGRWVAIAMLSLGGYIFAATWVLKLIPLYAGYPYGTVRPGPLLDWYTGSWREALDVFGTAALGPAGVVYGLLPVATPFAIWVLAWQVGRIRRDRFRDTLPASAARSSPR